jgi:hypothetical protein
MVVNYIICASSQRNNYEDQILCSSTTMVNVHVLSLGHSLVHWSCRPGLRPVTVMLMPESKAQHGPDKSVGHIMLAHVPK